MVTRSYLGIAEQTPENRSMSFPAFPGTVTIGGDFAELMNHARDALASVVTAMEQDGQQIPASFEPPPDLRGNDPWDYQDPRSALLARGAQMLLAAETANQGAKQTG